MLWESSVEGEVPSTCSSGVSLSWRFSSADCRWAASTSRSILGPLTYSARSCRDLSYQKVAPGAIDRQQLARKGNQCRKPTHVIREFEEWQRLVRYPDTANIKQKGQSRNNGILKRRELTGNERRRHNKDLKYELEKDKKKGNLDPCQRPSGPKI